MNDVKEQLVFSFKGTRPTSLPNWIADLTDDLIPYTSNGAPSDAKVHKGFWGSYSSMRSTVLSAAANLTAAYPTYKIVVTG